MALNPDSPQVTALLREVSRRFGHPVKTPSDFSLLADRVEAVTHEHISDSTIKRLFVPKLSYKTVTERTLNVLAAYTGHAHFEAFCNDLREEGGIESEMIRGECSVRSDDLRVGDRVLIAWLPDRECELKYLGERKYEVISAVNSKISPGDTFFCSVLTKGRCLWVDNLLHDGELYENYYMGRDHGLSRVEVRSNY